MENIKFGSKIEEMRQQIIVNYMGDIYFNFEETLRKKIYYILCDSVHFEDLLTTQLKGL